jgi:hypothetical protein
MRLFKSQTSSRRQFNCARRARYNGPDCPRTFEPGCPQFQSLCQLITLIFHWDVLYATVSTGLAPSETDSSDHVPVENERDELAERLVFQHAECHDQRINQQLDIMAQTVQGPSNPDVHNSRGNTVQSLSLLYATVSTGLAPSETDSSDHVPVENACRVP